MQRILLHKYKIDLFSYVVIFQILVGMVIGVFAIAIGIPNPDLTGLWISSIACVALYGVGHVLYAKTLQQVDASIFSTLFATHALWLMLIGVIVFRESLELRHIVGAALIFTSVLILVKPSSWKKLDRGLIYGLLTGLIFAIALTLWIYVGRHTETMTWAAWSFIGAGLVALLIRPRTVKNFIPFFTGSKQILLRMGVLAFIYAIGSVAMIYAYKFGEISIVSPLRQTGIIVTVLLALAFIPAERTRIGLKILAAIVSFVGVLFLL